MSGGNAQAILRIDLDAIAANYTILTQAARGVPVAGVVKANGYGLGIAEIGRTLFDAGARKFFVANVAEGADLRAVLGSEAAIYVIGGPRSGDFSGFRAFDLVPVLNHLGDVEIWREKGAGPCALHFDTGMNRLGLDAGETARVIEDPTLLDGVAVTLGMSHFASSEDPDDALNAIQIERFRAITSRLNLPRWSLCNTSAILRFPDALYDLARAGYGLYGGNPLPHRDNPMRPAVQLHARVLQVKPVRAGESIGYNATYRAERDDRVAVLALGYADGYLRSQSSRGHVYWRGMACPIVGRVSMDLTTVSVGHLADAPKPGDMVEIIGPHQPIDALAASAGTNGYEMLTRLGARYQRVYIHNP
ncbi:MAG: alanine racemase [Rhodospirillales bacterium]|nr:alanine racemase [Alphaproteobacteria bacterium]MCB9986276.1 alanine racemase [Rhodospirillales bacterium]USO07171.1 MAG: alanine racemase [Rhodospirillales bacterium]